MDTNALLDAVRARHGLTSDYQLGQLMGWSTGKVCNYRAGRSRLGDESALAVANALGMDAGYVLAVVAAERAQSAAARAAWERAAARLSVAASAVLAVWMLGVAVPGSDALAASYGPAPALLIMTNAIALALLPVYLWICAWSLRPQLAAALCVMWQTVKIPRGEPFV